VNIVNNLPPYALLAMQTGNASQGIVFPQSNKTICIENGSVASNSVININNNIFGVRLTPGTGTAGGTSTDCSTGTGSIAGPPAINLTVQAYGTNGSGGCIGTTGFEPTACSAITTPIALPTVPAPTDSINRVNQAAVCLTQSGTTYAAFQPGLYTDVTKLNSPCSGAAADFEWFSPGTYYFDYGSTPWQWPTTLVGGTPTSGASTINSDGSTNTPAITTVDPTKSASLAGNGTGGPTGLAKIAAFPNSCADPGVQNQYNGVEFVFGGASTFTPGAGNAEICGTYNQSSPPVAFYGVSSPLTISGRTISAQTLCGTTSAPTICSGSAAGNTVINPTSNGHEQFLFKGFFYAPVAPIVMNLKNSPGQFFSWGLLAWNFNLNVNGVSNTVPFIQLPKGNQGFSQTTVTSTTYAYQYLDVWTCPVSTNACPQTGTPNVRVKLQYSGSGTPKILSWSHRRSG
jgi:hypothetical protein